MIHRLIPLALSVAMGLLGGSPSLAADKAEAAVAKQPGAPQVKKESKAAPKP